MKYSVQQISETNEICIIGTISDNDTDYINFIKARIQKIDGVKEYEYVLEQDLHTIANKCGFYLVHYKDGKIELIEQYNQISVGYIYNSILFNTKKMFTWSRILNDFDVVSINVLTDGVVSNDNIPMENIREIDMGKITKNPNILVIGNRGTGKTIMALDVMDKLYKRHNYNKIIIISPTITKTNLCSQIETLDYYNKIQIFDNCSNGIIENNIEQLINGQTNKFNKKKSRHNKRNKYNQNNNVLLMLDDCLSSETESITNLFVNGKQIGITVVSVVQSVDQIISDRKKFDYVCLFGQNTVDKQKIHEQYFSMIPDMETFNYISNELTQNYGSMIVSNTGNRNNYFNQLFRYRVQLHD